VQVSKIIATLLGAQHLITRFDIQLRQSDSIIPTKIGEGTVPVQKYIVCGGSSKILGGDRNIHPWL